MGPSSKVRAILGDSFAEIVVMSVIFEVDEGVAGFFRSKAVFCGGIFRDWLTSESMPGPASVVRKRVRLPVSERKRDKIMQDDRAKIRIRFIIFMIRDTPYVLIIAILVNNAFKTVQQRGKDKEDICRRADARQRYLTQDFTL